MKFDLKLVSIVALSSCLLTGCDITKSISIPANAHLDHGKSTINGDVTIGDKAVVDGDLSTINGDVHAGIGSRTGKLTTVNGDITVDHDAQTGELTNVNGSIQLGHSVVANGNVTSVNGSIDTADGAQVHGDVTDVNGNIVLCNTQAGGSLRFVNGTLLVAANSQIKGDVTAKKPEFDSGNASDEQHIPVMVVGPHAVIGGTITFERPGKLFVSDSAVIHAVTGVTAQKFTGVAPAGVTLPSCNDN